MCWTTSLVTVLTIFYLPQLCRWQVSTIIMILLRYIYIYINWMNPWTDTNTVTGIHSFSNGHLNKGYSYIRPILVTKVLLLVSTSRPWSTLESKPQCQYSYQTHYSRAEVTKKDHSNKNKLNSEKHQHQQNEHRHTKTHRHTPIMTSTPRHTPTLTPTSTQYKALTMCEWSFSIFETQVLSQEGKE